MKLQPVLFVLLLLTVSATAQKLKGSKIVTTSTREIGDFENIEVEDNLELFLSKGDNTELSIEADDNLHESISVSLIDGTLRLSLNGEISAAKKLAVNVTYTSGLKMVVAKENSNVVALTDIDLTNFTIKASGSAKIFCNVKAAAFTLMANDKAKAELNLSSDNATIELSKNSQLKALISAPKMKFDMYQKSTATIEGDVINLKLRVDSNSTFIGKNFTVTNADIVAEGSSNISLIVTGNAGIEASGKSEIDLHGEQSKIEIKKFTENASIRKRALK